MMQHVIRWRIPLIIVALWLTAIVFTYGLLSQRELVFTLIALMLLGVVALATWRKLTFSHGVLSIAATAILVPSGYRIGSTSVFIPLAFVVTVGLVTLWSLRLAVKEDEFDPRLPLVAPLLAFVAVNIISYLWGISLRDPLLTGWQSSVFIQPLALVVNILLPLTSLMVAHKLADENTVYRLVWVILIAGLTIYAIDLTRLSTAARIVGGTRGLASMWIGAFALAHGLFNAKLHLGLRIVLSLSALIIVAEKAVLETGWLSGWIPLIVAYVVLLWLKSRPSAVAAGAATVAIVLANASVVYQRIVVKNIEEGSSNRLELWLENLRIFSQRPLFGAGPAGYTMYNQAYAESGFAITSTHNGYLDIIGQVGLVGSVIFVWLMISTLIIALRLWHLSRQGVNERTAFAAAMLAGLFGAAAAMVFGDWLIPYAYNQTVSEFGKAEHSWLMLGCLMFLYHRRPTNAPEQMSR